MIDSTIDVWIGGLLVGTIGGAVVATANLFQTRLAGRQAIALARETAQLATDRQKADWAREDKVAARLDRSDKVSADQFLQLLHQGAETLRLGGETKGLVNHRLTVALQAQLLATRGMLSVLSDKSDPSAAVKARILELEEEITVLQEELTLRGIQQDEEDRKNLP